jgi:hypothetical protein
MKALVLLGAAALICGAANAAPPAPSLADDAADVAARFCYDVARGSLRWDPAKLDEERALLGRYGITAGIPTGLIDTFSPMAASTFNRSMLGSRASTGGHVLLAVGGQVPGCRVSIAAPPGAVTAAALKASIGRHGWTAAPALFRAGPPIERHSFLRRTDNGAVMLLDLLFVTEPSGNFRAMATVMPPPAGLKLPEGF